MFTYQVRWPTNGFAPPLPPRSIPGRGSRGPSADSERARALQGMRDHQQKIQQERQPQQQHSNGPAAAATANNVSAQSSAVNIS